MCSCCEEIAIHADCNQEYSPGDDEFVCPACLEMLSDPSGSDEEESDGGDQEVI